MSKPYKLMHLVPENPQIGISKKIIYQNTGINENETLRIAIASKAMTIVIVQNK